MPKPTYRILSYTWGLEKNCGTSCSAPRHLKRSGVKLVRRSYLVSLLTTKTTTSSPTDNVAHGVKSHLVVGGSHDLKSVHSVGCVPEPVSAKSLGIGPLTCISRPLAITSLCLALFYGGPSFLSTCTTYFAISTGFRRVVAASEQFQ